jgi:hypothetical protein
VPKSIQVVPATSVVKFQQAHPEPKTLHDWAIQEHVFETVLSRRMEQQTTRGQVLIFSRVAELHSVLESRKADDVTFKVCCSPFDIFNSFYVLVSLLQLWPSRATKFFRAISHVI